MRRLLIRTVSLVSLLALTGGVAYAQSGLGDNFEFTGYLGTVIDALITVTRTILLPLMVLAVFWAGYTMATARGNVQQYTKGKQILYRALIGTAIIADAELLKNVVDEFGQRL